MLPTEKGRSPFKIYPELEGHTVLVVHSERVRSEWADILRSMQKMQTFTLDELPDDLFEYIKENGIESIVIHPNEMREVEVVIKAHQEGIKVVIVPKSEDADVGFRDINARAMNVGLATVDYNYRIYIDEVITLLASEFNK